MNLFKIELEPKNRILLYFFLMIFLGFLLYCLTVIKDYGGNVACAMLVYIVSVIVMILLLICFCLEIRRIRIELTKVVVRQQSAPFSDAPFSDAPFSAKPQSVLNLKIYDSLDESNQICCLAGKNLHIHSYQNPKEVVKYPLPKEKNRILIRDDRLLDNFLKVTFVEGEKETKKREFELYILNTWSVNDVIMTCFRNGYSFEKIRTLSQKSSTVTYCKIYKPIYADPKNEEDELL